MNRPVLYGTGEPAGSMRTSAVLTLGLRGGAAACCMPCGLWRHGNAVHGATGGPDRLLACCFGFERRMCGALLEHF
jgi:hypothetical protein